MADHFGVGVTETVALSHLRARGALTPRDLAKHTGLTSSTVTALLDRLQDAGLADRSAHPTGRRKIVVALTSRGEEQMDHTEKWLAAVLEGMVGVDSAMVTHTLTQLAAALDEQASYMHQLPPGSVDNR
ncbi:MarR family winged helix-turn-helix transcriptional regulator [Leekyejoonella antrihumi]|uniref:MarR family transcriptional regulator n=1 Tax=Leekyejoonella antrihumi TaxID=1660198 RepID=A0A563DV38_9MICO|nr:MarR family transcriptional regulator [Leekyejoonella antrihumi]TWP34105.1 MarR family transcriptional regulator [Leekyejoonella antrihumi]